MKYFFSILLVLVVTGSHAQQEPLIRLNHMLVVVDSATYTALCDSSFMDNSLWFAHEKELNYWKGFYIIGENNYLEIFNQQSMKGDTLDLGDNWTCYASMKSNHFRSLKLNETYMDLEEDEDFKTLSFQLNDSVSPFEAWEMNQAHYESWTKKKFKAGMSFEPYDYNSKAESDSSNNYLFNDVIGINYSIPEADSSRAIAFFEVCGYSISERSTDEVSFENGVERITLQFEEVDTVTINSIELKLNETLKEEELAIGSTKLIIDGDTVTWSFR
jgi:hypothetical protein